MEGSGTDTVKFLEILYDNVGTVMAENDWLPALEAFANLAGGVCAGIYIYQHSDDSVPALVVWGAVPPTSMEEYAEKWMPLDPRLQQIRSGLLPVIFHDDLFITADEKELTPFFRDWEHKLTPVRYAVGARIHSSDNYELVLTVGLPTREDERIRRAIQVYDLLMPHLQRASQIHQLLVQKKSDQQAGDAVLDTLEFGVVFLDQLGAVCFENSKSREFVQRQDGLGVDNNSIVLSDQRANTAVANRIIKCLELQSDPAAVVPGDWISAARADVAEPYMILVSRFPPVPSFGLLSQPTVLIVISEPHTQAGVAIEMMARLYSLTPGEANVCALLEAGLNVAEMAVTENITRNAIRFHLKNIFAKTGVRNQAQLVRLTLSLIPINMKIPQAETL